MNLKTQPKPMHLVRTFSLFGSNPSPFGSGNGFTSYKPVRSRPDPYIKIIFFFFKKKTDCLPATKLPPSSLLCLTLSFSQAQPLSISYLISSLFSRSFHLQHWSSCRSFPEASARRRKEPISESTRNRYHRCTTMTTEIGDPPHRPPPSQNAVLRRGCCCTPSRTRKSSISSCCSSVILFSSFDLVFTLLDLDLIYASF